MDLSSATRGISVELPQLYQLLPCDVRESSYFQALLQSEIEKPQLLSSIPLTQEPSFRPLHILYLFLTELPGPWSTFDLLHCQHRLSKTCPRDDNDNELSWVPAATDRLIKDSYNAFSDFIREGPGPALQSETGGHTISHRQLQEFVCNFKLPGISCHRAAVAIALPNGPLLAATSIAVTTYYTAAPVNPAVGPEQLRADVVQSGARFLLTTRDLYNRLNLERWPVDHEVTVVLLAWSHGGDITMESPEGTPLHFDEGPPVANKADDIALVLFTSGTSGEKKVVPFTLHSIIIGTVFVIDSWGLSASDVCLNMMPLYHVGGLLRNIFAPVFSGGSTICCSAFDPSTFWDVVQDLSPTWYYASPSMHSVILAGAPDHSELQRSQIRLVCNAAGALLPSLAHQLRDTFDCVVLPSYGMTECMPISTPPLDYKLDRSGTSGRSIGPDLAILNQNGSPVPHSTIGRICVRGEPVFHGYLRPDGSLDRSAFMKDGYFDTGDLGYLDEDGYLYITGRSKEIINRGGELISPFEVENAIMSAAAADNTPISGRISQVLAFSAGHDVLQEVVAVVLVAPPGKPRVDLESLHASLQSSLQQAKWPVLIVYMDDLPKKNNKILRINLAQRLGLPELTDETPFLARHLEAECPPLDTPVSSSILCRPCIVDRHALKDDLAYLVPKHLDYFLKYDSESSASTLLLAPKQHTFEQVSSYFFEDLKKSMSVVFDGYAVPKTVHLMQHPFARNVAGHVDETSLQQALEEFHQEKLQDLSTSIEGQVAVVFAKVLMCEPTDIPHNVDFLSLGGDSLRAGRLVSLLRSTFQVSISISIIFNGGTIKSIAAFIEDAAQEVVENENESIGCTETYSSTNPFLMILQLLPLAVMYPMRRALQWTIFIVALNYTQQWPTNLSVPGRLLNLTLSILIGRIMIRLIAPFFGVLAKWLIIGRYREGMYPMWGPDHTRWWMVDKIVLICGKGLFGSTEITNRFYYRMMGARIGRGVKLSGASLGEWDLLDIRDGASLTLCTCRPFAVERNTSMYLGKIVIGENASVGASSIVTPGSVVPSDTCIGPNSSTWELEDADEANRDLSSGAAAKPHWLLEVLFTLPLTLVAWFISILPWLGGLVGMVIDRPSTGGRSPLRDILDWFTAPERIAFHYLALVLRTFCAPFIFFALTLVVKTLLDFAFGKLDPKSGISNTVAVWRAALIKTLLPVSRLHEMTNMFGQHYEATSIALRLLGARIGERVYWPGTGPRIGDYHLLNIGNDVVFGSRSHLVTTDGLGAEEITVRDNAMIADRVCLLPGVDVGERTILGSGALTRRGKAYPSGGTYVGSKGGDAICLVRGKEAAPEKSTDSRVHDQSRSTATLVAEQMSPSDSKNAHVEVLPTNGTDSPVTSSIMSKEKPPSEADKSSHSISETAYSSSESQNDASPFGRAFYMKLAPYHVIGPAAIFCYSSFTIVFTAFYWNVPNISAIQIVSIIMHRVYPQAENAWVEIAIMYWMTAVIIAIFTTLQAVLALGIVIGAKWLLMGRRKPGNYDWDKSSYCQRWQIFLCIEKLRRSCYRGQGVLGFLTGTHWIVMYFRALGADIGKDCALFANGRPALMFTEPDLISLGDRVAVDDASIVAHINTRGKFDLNRLEVGNRCVLRSGSRLLSGASMKDDSCLLEHTLVMGGDVVEAGWTMQGWPAERFTKRRIAL